MRLDNYLSIVRRWILVLLAVPLLVAGVAFGVSKLQTPQYVASLTLWVSQSSTATGQQYADILAAERLAKTYGALITKRPVLQETIRELQLDMTPEELSRHIAVKLVRDTQLLEVTARNTDPALAATIVNKLAEVFEKQNIEMQKQTFNEATQKLSGQVSQLEGQIKEAQSQLASLKAVKQPTDEQRVELERLNTSLSQYQVSYSSVLKSLEDIRLSEANSLNNVSVAEQAAVPQDPVSPRTTLNVLLGLVLGLMLAGGLVGLLEYLDDTFKVPEDTQSALDLTPLGVVELIGGKRSRGMSKKKNEPSAPVAGLVSMTSVNSSAAESYRLLRANLDFAALDRPMRKLLITSALPQEGKSTTAANLAVVMAQSGKQVLLLDLDLRRPSQHKRFKLPNYIGLTSVLLGTAGLDEALQQVGIENLRVLTSGPLPPSPGDTLTSQAMEALLATLSQRFDVLIADSPPVLVASDAVAISPRVDGVLFVVAADSTSKRVAKNALETLRRTGSLLLGAVLNMQPQTGKQSYYYYNYKNYMATEGTTGPLGGEARLKQLGTPALAAQPQPGKQGR